MLERKIIGITGSIGTGKSTVLKFLTDKGYPTIDADQVVHSILSEDDTLWAKLVTYFGDEIIDAEGNIARSELARIVFEDTDELKHLEEMIHPLVLTRIGEMLEALPPQSSQIIFIEATVLLRSALRNLCAEIWLIKADKQEQLSRLVNFRHYSEEEAAQRLQAVGTIEPPDDIPYQIIDNSGAIEYTHSQVLERLSALQ